MVKDETWSVDRINRKDILLVTAKVGTILVRVGIAIGMAGIGIALAGIAIKGGIPPEGLADVAPANMASVTGAILLLLVIAMASLALAYDFVTRLAQIIDTVGEGDPFTLGNAGRLRRMAWLAIVIQALGLLAMLPSGWLKAQLAGGMFHLGSDFSLMGVGLAIVLFVLARVFRQGAAMRADLEGTV